MKLKAPLLIFIFFFLLPSYSAFAQSVQKNPLVMQLPNYKLTYSERKFDAMEFPLSDVELISISGEKTYATFKFDPKGRASRHPNENQILQTYFDRVRSLKGKPFAKEKNYATFQLKANGKEYWCVMETYLYGESYSLVVVESEQLQLVNNAEEMLNKLNATGEINLYIQFATGSAELSSASSEIIEDIAKMLNMSPNTEIMIEGHTDNVGSAEANKKLSFERAESVKRALAKKRINPNRLKTVGWGAEHPIASNADEKSRKKNRRVVIKKTK